MPRGRHVCCVPKCETREGDPGISCHRIPKKEPARSEWLKAISRADDKDPTKPWKPSKRSYLCSKHFLETDFYQDLSKKYLRPNAKPTVFPDYPKYMQPKTTTRKKPAKRSMLPVPIKRRKITTPQEQNVLPDHGLEPTPAGDSPGCNAHPPPKPDPAVELIADLNHKLHLSQRTIDRLWITILNLRRQLAIEKPPPTDIDNSIENILTDAENGDSKALFLLEQIKVYGKQRPRWSEHTLRMAVLWKSKSTSSYKFVRENFVNLPSITTLQRFVGPSDLQTGFTDLVVQRLHEEIKTKSDAEIWTSLIVDEMAIKPYIQYNKNADKVVGVANNNAPKEEDSDDEDGVVQDEGEQEEDDDSYSKDVAANKLLCFVLKGLSTNFRIPVAYYMVKDLKGDQLSKFILFVVKEVEKIGFRILRMVSDDASTNVKAFQQLCGGTLTHQIPHPSNAERPLFISFDPCHILKNIRNQFLDQDRSWTNNGQPITSQPIKDIYFRQLHDPDKLVRFLTRKVVFPSNFEKMNVKRAKLIFSTEVIAALQTYSKDPATGQVNLDATIKFLEMIQKWFDIHNVCNTSHYIHSRNENKAHFWLVEDERLKWLEEDFLTYLAEWKESTKGLGPSKGKSKALYFLTNETYQAIEITTRSSVACIKYLLNAGFHYVLTRKFTSDDIEGIFGAIRAAQGHNDQANALGVIYAIESMLKMGIFASAPDGNTSETSRTAVKNVSRTKNVLRRKLPAGSAIPLNVRQKKLVEMLANPPDVGPVSTKTAGITMISGYIIRYVNLHHKCPNAMAKYTGNGQEVSNFFIKTQDRGGLTYPSKPFVNFVSLMFNIMLASKNRYTTNAIVKSWTKTLVSKLPADFITCPCNEDFHTEELRQLIVKSVCIIFVINITKRDSNLLDSHPRFNMQPRSKKVKKV